MTAPSQIEQRIAHLREARNWRVGDRVRVPVSGRTGTIVGDHRHHSGFLVEWDAPVFGVIRGRVTAPNLERIEKGGKDS